MNLKRIYEFRFQNINKTKKQETQNTIALFIYKKLNYPNVILDPAAGECEFINSIPANEKWAIDQNKDLINLDLVNVKTIVGNSLTIELPNDYFDAIFISNFLEHLPSPDKVSFLLEKMYYSLKNKGRIAIMGPNFKYAYKDYFDFADHYLPLTEQSIAEHLYGTGFNILKIYPKFLPLSFKSNLPPNKILVKIYLSVHFLWSFFGKQFLILAAK